MAKLVIILAGISLMAACLQICLSKPVDIQHEDENPDSSGSGFGDKVRNKEDRNYPDSDDEDYGGESGSGSNTITFTQEETWKFFYNLLKKNGFNVTEIINQRLLAINNPTHH